MKKYLFLSTFILQLTIATAQQGKYIPFPSNMIVNSYSFRADHDIQWRTASRFEIKGDTVINGLHYSKYYVASGVKSYEIKSLTRLKGAIRNDIPSKKVFLYSFINNTEELLYDFNLQVGDTLFKNNGFKFYHSLLDDEFYEKIDTVWVSRIDSILMPHDNQYHKRFHFTTKFQIYDHMPWVTITSDTISFNSNLGFDIKISSLIEGVGLDHDPITMLHTFEWYYESKLICSSIDNKTVCEYPKPPVPPYIDIAYCNSILTGIDDKENNAATFTLYPNPSKGKFNLETRENGITFFEISNLFGVKILSSKVEHNKMEIDLSSESSGIYFIRYFLKDGTSSTKKIRIQ